MLETGSNTLRPIANGVAIQGELGSNSHLAVNRVFGADAVTVVPCRLSADVFVCLQSGLVSRAVLPIENSLYGSVFEHYDLLLEHDLRIVGETMLRIQHNLIVFPGTKMADLTRVVSHPVALAQCRNWLRTHDQIEVIPTYDTAGGVKIAMETPEHDVAAIAPELAASMYSAEVLEAHLEDHQDNYTRFCILGQEVPMPSDYLSDKASVAFSLEHRTGTLMKALSVFERAGLNLTKIESRPVHGRPWEYIFFADLQFDVPRQWDAAMYDLRQTCLTVRELGRYLAATPK